MQVSSCWTAAASVEETLTVCEKLALAHSQAAGDFGTDIADAITGKRYADLCNFDFVYSNDDDPIKVGHARQAVAFYSKLADLDIGIDKETVAFNMWLQTEESCSQTNELFRAFNLEKFNFLPSDYVSLRHAKRFIKSVLGRCPTISEIPLSFGPGATTSIKKKDACPTVKMAEKPTCSTSILAAGLLPEIVRECPHWFSQHVVSSHIDEDDWLCDVCEFNLAPGKLEFVPKSAKTFRTIDKQPTVNTALQRGIGKVLKRRLYSAGLDLTDQSRNKEMARIGSLDGSLATIDLSNASDTIATQLVKYLLPAPWFKLLNAARTHSTTYKKREIPLEKFSSQGNGFTFPLESLIFWALTRSCADAADVSVYGDDIICPSKDYDRVVNILRVCGFQVNLRKSFATGPFRESCGGDYFLGTNIRPYYLKKLVSGEVLFSLHNYYFRHGLLEFAEIVKKFIPSKVRIFGPDGYGDGHLLSDFYTPLRRKKEEARGWDGHYFSTYRKVPRRVISVYPGDYITPLYLVYVKGGGDHLDYLDKVANGIHQSPSGRPFWDLPGDDDGAYEKILVYKFGAID